MVAAEKAGVRGVTSAAKLCSGGVPPHLAKVYEIWPAQQKKSMEELGRLLTTSQEEAVRMHTIFSRVRSRMGDETLEAVLRVVPSGDIRPCLEMADEFRAEEKRACQMIYSLYTLGIGATTEVRGMLSKVLSQKLSPIRGSEAPEKKAEEKGRAKRLKPSRGKNRGRCCRAHA